MIMNIIENIKLTEFNNSFFYLNDDYIIEHIFDMGNISDKEFNILFNNCKEVLTILLNNIDNEQ